MTVSDIHERLKNFTRWGNIYVPEFTFGGLRIDAIIIDLKHRWVRGFEIKVNKADFNKDKKWTEYSSFCSALSIVCPEGLIEPTEVEKPFGLLWVEEIGCVWKKRPKNIQMRNSLAWLWTYVKVLEYEMPRLEAEIGILRAEIKR